MIQPGRTANVPLQMKDEEASILMLEQAIPPTSIKAKVRTRDCYEFQV